MNNSLSVAVERGVQVEEGVAQRVVRACGAVPLLFLRRAEGGIFVRHLVLCSILRVGKGVWFRSPILKFRCANKGLNLTKPSNFLDTLLPCHLSLRALRLR